MFIAQETHYYNMFIAQETRCYNMFIAQETLYYGIHTWAIHNKFIIHWIPQNITRLIGGIYTRACNTHVNTKPTDSWYSPVSNE